MLHLRRRDAGISMVLVIILLLLTFILGIVAICLWDDYKDKERVAARLRSELLRLQTERSEIEGNMRQINIPTGFQMEGADLPKAKQAADNFLRKQRDQYFSSDAMEQIPRGQDPKPLTSDQKDSLNKIRNDSELYGTIRDLAGFAADRAMAYQNIQTNLQRRLLTAEMQVANAKGLPDKIKAPKIAYGQKLVARIATVTDQIAKENEVYDARKTKYEEDRQKAEEEIATETEKYAEDEIRVNNEIRELRRQLEELKIKEIIKHEISFAHGKILRPDIPNKMAFISIGSRERVVPGLKFLVGKRGRRGKFEYKAKVEVKKAWMTYSEVAIIEVYDPQVRPVIEGDLIVNPLFDRDRPIIVAFVGEERAVRLRYTVSEATRRIMEMGSVVRKDVDLDIDYVIFTETASQRQRANYEAFNKAIFLEIPIAEASEIYRFLGD